MRTLRAAVRAVALVIWSATSVGFVSVLNGLIGLADRGLLPVRPTVQLRDRGVALWGAGCCRILNLHVDVRGDDPPQPPFLLVSNHLSYVDVVLLNSITHGVLVAKKAIRSWPGVGLAAAVGGTVFIDRRAHRDILRVNETIEAAVDRGQGVVVFPEGTSSRGQEVLDFRGSLLLPFVGASRPIHTASISYRTPEGEPPAQTHVAWWGDMTFADHVWDLLKIPRIEATVTFGRHRPDDAGDRKALAAALTEQVRRDFIPTDAPPDAVPEAVAE
jgi:1-acyl-sn-glycerol-3-phosphate acyltransferase